MFGVCNGLASDLSRPWLSDTTDQSSSIDRDRQITKFNAYAQLSLQTVTGRDTAVSISDSAGHWLCDTDTQPCPCRAKETSENT